MVRKRPAPCEPAQAPVTADMPTLAGIPGGEDASSIASEWALVAYAGAALGRIFALRPGASLIGRAPDVQVALLDGEVSRHHARIGVIGGQVWLEDLGSTNGTLVNGTRIQGVAVLHGGDRVVIGGHVLKLVAMDPLERAFHETLLDLSTKDPLTGLANRTRALAELQTRFGLSVRYGRPLSVLMCDLDHFKHINDTWGHAIGDGVLQHFANTLRTQLRAVDLVGRIGGEEFAIVLPDTDLERARAFATRVQQRIAEAPFSAGGRCIPLTVSIGISTMHTLDADAELALGRSDRALYNAKQLGRNRIESAPSVFSR